MREENPLVSIIVRTKDRPKLLVRALQSIAAQTYSPIEVVLINDGGQDMDIDEAQKILGDLSLVYARLERNTGRAGAGNAGIGHSKGRYIGFLDDDDEFYPEHVSTLISFLVNSDYKVAYTDSLMVYKEYDSATHEFADMKKELIFSRDFDYAFLIFENYIPFMCLLFERESLVTSGGFDGNFELYEDWDLLLRIGDKYPFYHIKKITAHYNQWSLQSQISQGDRNPDFLKDTYLKILFKHKDKITPERIRNYMSENVSTRNVLNEFKTEITMQKIFLTERESYLNTLNLELQDKDSRIDKLQAELEGKKSQINSYSAELEEKSKQADKLYAELKERGPRIEKLYDDLKKKDLQIDHLAVESRELQFRLDKLNTELKENSSKLEARRIELQRRDSMIERLHIKLEEKDSQLDELNDVLRARDSQLDALIAALKGRDSRLDELNDVLRARDSQLDTLIAALKGRDTRLDELKAEFRARDSQLDTLIAALKGRDTRLDELKAEFRARESQLDSLITELKGRDSQLELLLGTLKGKDSAIDNLSNEVREKEAQLIKLQFALRDRDAEIIAMRKTRGWRLLERYRKIRDHVFLRKNAFDGQENSPEKIAASEKDKSFQHLIPKSDDKIEAYQAAGNVPAVNKAPQISRFLNGTIDSPIQSRVSIIIPAKDAGDEFDYALRRMSQQEGVKDIEIIIIDSGSTDNTIGICKRYTQKIFHISPENFHHSYARNLGAEKATGEFLVFTVQDACPVGYQWLYKLIHPIQQGKASAVSAQQIPRSDADLFASWSYWNHNINFLGYDRDHFSNRVFHKKFDEIDILKKRVMASLDSVCLGIKKEVFDAYRFKADYAEDLELGLRLLADSHTLMFQSSNAIVHSHNRSVMYFFSRSYTDTVNLWNILGIARQNMPAEYVLGAISFLYSKLKWCISTLNILESRSMPSLMLLSLVDLLDDNKYSIDQAGQFLRGNPSMDEFFEKYKPDNRVDIVQRMNSNLKNNIMSFSDFMRGYIGVQDIREDFLNSMYKLFCITAGNYLGENTQGKFDMIEGRI